MCAAMSIALHLVPLAGFAGLMTMAAFEDFRRLIIPNAVPAGLCVLWPFHLATAPGLGLAAGAAAAGCAAAVFLAGALLFSRGLVGGGDVKLLAVATLWAGPATPSLLVLTGLLGGLLCLFVLTPLGQMATAASGQAVLNRTGGAAANDKRPAVVPYGVAIAAAALIVTVPPNFS
jgi:prepilin peptidase CpaA